ncbi:MAG: hydroxymethylbilane synthase [Acidimicrobiales bacterium]
MLGPVVLATRGSPLALCQADLAATALGLAATALGLPAGQRVAKLVVTSAGDLRPDVPIHELGGRGVFAAEIDRAVAEGRAQAAVHSAKDLPSRQEEGITIAAFLPRADPRDALVGRRLADLPPGARIATGSVRRRAQLAWLRPDLTFQDLRGNMATRLGKIPAGGALVAAMSALDRLGMALDVAQALSPTEMLPQVGQGAIALCCRAGDSEVETLLRSVDDRDTRLAVEAERAWLAAVGGGGCDLPVGALCTVDGDRLDMEALIASLDGHVVVRSSATGLNGPEELGGRLATELLARGGRSLLEPQVPR